MKKKKMIIMVLMVLIVFIYVGKLQVSPMEELNIIAGIGFDINKKSSTNVEYGVAFSIYDFNKKGKNGVRSTNIKAIKAGKTREQGSDVIKTESNTIGDTREKRQLVSSKPYTIGTERILILGEEQAFYGILNIINILFSNPKINDTNIFIVCKGKAEDILRFKVKGYPSSSDYMEGMVKHATNYNFLSSEYGLLNIYVKLDSEGENLVLPYLEIIDENISFTGMALFKGNKMAYVLPMDESKIMNMLREKKGKGILSLQDGSDKYLNYDAMVKRKVKCNKTEGKYEFIIDLSFQGDIIENTLYKDINKESESEFETLMAKKIEKMCNEFLEKVKNVYRIDCLNLGMCAAAKYGRETGIDWNEEVSNADIKVNVVVKIDKIGTGQY
ncbi:Ger(x)C family spore germination protein [Clostridium sp.]|uniref:Ger(x)C family spore germination protein n=1 Tax=Clostridium sp. TaxID=1506 RepID=UPI001A445486|nr:Ger(x)C family spore germination protein [Clostridium sp.]MBK5235503.1 Ger(x)C family spore germination protein [Clostridium sp.]